MLFNGRSLSYNAHHVVMKVALSLTNSHSRCYNNRFKCLVIGNVCQKNRKSTFINCIILK